MKAMTIDSYGGSDRLKLGDLPDPVPRPTRLSSASARPESIR